MQPNRMLLTFALLRQAAMTVICALWLIGVLLLLTPLLPTQASPLANIPTATPLPPTAVPTEVPTELPTDVPPTAQPTDPPPTPTAIPPSATALPPTATPTSPPPREDDDDDEDEPTATPVPATATAEPSPAPPEAPVPPEAPAEVTISKLVDVAQRQPGEQAFYTLQLRNEGAAAAHDVVVTDAVPAMLEVIDLRSSKGSIVLSGQTVTAYPALLEPGEAVTLLVSVRVRNDAPAGEVLNWAAVTTSSPGDRPDNNRAQALFTVIRAQPPVLQRLPRTGGNETPGLLAPWWTPWTLLGLALLGLGAVLAYQIAPSYATVVPARATPRRRYGRVAHTPVATAQPLARPAVTPAAAWSDQAICDAWQGGTPLAELVRLVSVGGNRHAASQRVLRLLDGVMEAEWARISAQRLDLLQQSAAYQPEAPRATATTSGRRSRKRRKR